MTRSSKALLLRAAALIISVVPVAAVTLNYFPIWRERGSGTLISGFTVFLIVLCIYPILKAIKHVLRSPSVFMMWLFLFTVFMLIDSIAYEMTVISFVGTVSNLIGGILFKLAKRGIKHEEP